MANIEVIHISGAKRGDSTRGIIRDRAFEEEDIVIGRSRVAGGVESAWHHHGKRDVYGYVVSGTLRFDFGKGGKGSVVAVAGDFFHIPPGLVHRDVNPDGRKEATVVNIMFGKGPPVVNVEGPQKPGYNRVALRARAAHRLGSARTPDQIAAPAETLF